MSEAWLCIDEDSPELDAYIVKVAADAVASVTRWFDEVGIAAGDARRAPMIAHVAELASAKCREAIASIRLKRACEGTPANVLH
jgi:acetaldehyde dehydrogenase (acetylating)